MSKLSTLLNKFDATYDSIKDWFKRSETIFLARLATIAGFVTAFTAQMDWSPLWSLFSTGTEFSGKQVFWIGVSILGSGITLEMARRRGADL